MFAINGSYPHPEFSTTDCNARFTISSVTNRPNVLCTTTGTNSNYGTAFLTHPVLAGQKVYVEFVPQNFQGTLYVGFATPGFSTLTATAFLGANNTSCGFNLGDGVTTTTTWWDSGGLIAGGAGGGTPPASGHNVGMAIDFVNYNVWQRVDGGFWNFGAGNSPVTGIGGYNFTQASSAAWLAATSFRIGISSKSGPESILLNAGATYAPPAGYHTLGTLPVG